MRALCVFASLLLLTACVQQPRQPEPRGSGVGFVGWQLADAEEGGALVQGTVAGPAAIAGLMRGDRIVRIDGAEVDAARAQAMIAASAPGTRLRLEILRGTAAVQMQLVVDERERWSGPANYPAAVPFAATGLAHTAHTPEYAIQQALLAEPTLVPVSERLDRMFTELAQHDAGYHKLPLIRMALMRPRAMAVWRDAWVRQLRPGAGPRGAVVQWMCETLALACPAPMERPSDTPVSLAEFAATVSAANHEVAKVFAAAQIDRAQTAGDLHYLMETAAAERTLLAQPQALRGIRAMQASMRVDLAALTAVLDALLATAQRPLAHQGPARKPPARLAAFVQGEIIDYAEVDGGYVVIGGPGANRYDMQALYAVIDLGGDDVYRWGEGAPRETQTVVDLGGNDHYHGLRGGPGAGWLGVAVLIDRGGNDRYDSAIGGCGAGALGFGVLFDDAGADEYRCAAWSAGAGLYGGGALIDGGAETDAYLSETFSQGVGGPRGAGLLVDAGGADLYRANGPVASAYGTPGSFLGFSQGVGVGIRPYDFGGVGVLLDLGGDDRYEGGEFSQGGGYFWGVGLLYDEGGNDLYYGTRYAQGFAAHQAFGMLTDVAGDDVYWSTSAAGQAAAWDQSIATLFDGGGDDVYRGQFLSQGAAAHQSRASLHDAAGDDGYWSGREPAQGAAGDNAYHFRLSDPIHSLGVLLDEGGADRYSTGIRDGETRLRRRMDDPERGAGVAGIALDRE